MDSDQIKLGVAAALAVGGITFGAIEHNNLAIKEKELGALQLEIVDLNQRAAQVDELKKRNDALEEHVKKLEASLAAKAQVIDKKNKGSRGINIKKPISHQAKKAHKKH